MIFYILILCSVICSSCCVSFSKDKYLRLIFKFITINIIFIPAALRYGIGADYNNYIDIFNSVLNGDKIYQESGWFFLNKFVIKMGGNAQCMIALVAFLTIFFFFEEIDSKQWFVYAFVFICVIYSWVFTTLRQMLTMTMVFNALLKWQKQKKIRSFLIAILSYFIHKSALFYIPILLIAKFIKLKKRTTILLFFILAFFAFIIFPRIIDVILNLIGMSFYKSYLNSGEWINNASVNSGLGRLARYIVYFFIICLVPKKENLKSLQTLLLIYIATDYFSQSIVILNRIGRGILFLFPMLTYNYYQPTNKHNTRFLLMSLCMILLFLLSLLGGFSGSVPYKTIFSKY